MRHPLCFAALVRCSPLTTCVTRQLAANWTSKSSTCLRLQTHATLCVSSAKLGACTLVDRRPCSVAFDRPQVSEGGLDGLVRILQQYDKNLEKKHLKDEDDDDEGEEAGEDSGHDGTDGDDSDNAEAKKAKRRKSKSKRKRRKSKPKRAGGYDSSVRSGGVENWGSHAPGVVCSPDAQQRGRDAATAATAIVGSGLHVLQLGSN